MNITLFIVPIVLWILALIINTGKANFLIAGYNTAPQKEKDKINEKVLSKFMGKFLFILGLIQLVVPIASLLKPDNLKLIIMCVNIVFILVTIAGVIYINISKSFQK